jgi:AcrR family transcriptional regulator
MTDDVKTRRRYESRRRQEQAAQTRRDIVTAAGPLFRDRGYAVPMPVIAEAAGVAVETIYRIFGTKAGLFRAVVDALLAGGAARAERPVPERPAIQAIQQEPDPVRKIERFAALQPGVHRRAGPLLRALRDARASDPDLDRLWRELEDARLQGQGGFVDHLAREGALRGDRSPDDAKDTLWTLCSLTVHDLFVIDRGWAPERYAAWLTSALQHELLEPDGARPGEPPAEHGAPPTPTVGPGSPGGR